MSCHRLQGNTIPIVHLGLRAAKHTISDVDARIASYENKLQELKTALLEQVTLQAGVTVVQTEATVVRMMNALEQSAEPHPSCRDRETHDV